MMRSFFAAPEPNLVAEINGDPTESSIDLESDETVNGNDLRAEWGQFAEAVRYLSDEDEDLDDLLSSDNENQLDSHSSSSSDVALPRKRQKLDIPYRIQRQQKLEANKQRLEAERTAWQEALEDITNMFKSK